MPEDLKKQLRKEYGSTSFRRTPPSFEEWLIERIAALEFKLREEQDAARAELNDMRKPVTPREWSEHCPRNVGGHVLPGNGIDIANAIIRSRTQSSAKS